MSDYKKNNVIDLDSKRNLEEKKSGKAPVIILLIIIVISVGYFAKDSILGRFAQVGGFQAQFKESRISVETGVKPMFVGYGKEFLYSTKDGVKYYDNDYNIKWNDTYTMISPTVINNGKYTAVAETQGRAVRVYNDTGNVYTLQTEGTILQLALSGNGAVAVIVSDGDTYKIQVYTETGQLIMDRYEQDTGIYPLALALSDDRRIMAVSYIDINDINLKSKVLLFYTSKEDTQSTATGEFFASTEKENVIIPAIKYTNNGYFVAVSDESIFAINSQGQEVWNYDLTNKISNLSFNSNIIAFSYGEGLVGKDSKQEGVVTILNYNGKMQGEYSIKRPVTYLKAQQNGIVIGGGREYVCIDEKGKVVWGHTATQDVKDIILINSPNVALYVTANLALVVDMATFEKATNTEVTEENEGNIEVIEEKVIEEKVIEEINTGETEEVVNTEVTE